jgi:uncharacterized membrane protein HdeD (DUF308 family)
MYILAALLALDVVLHAIVIVRYGTGDNNMPFLIFAIVDAVLAVIVFFAVPYAVWATLILSALGLIGLTVTFNKPQRDKTLDRIIWGVDALVIVAAIYLLFFAR